MQLKTIYVCSLVLVLLAGGMTGASLSKSLASAEVLRIGANTGILISFDPAVCYEILGTDMVDQLYDNLVELYLAEGKIGIKGELAKSWEVSDDGLTWTFHLREGLTFPSGNLIDAEAFVFSLKRMIALNKPPAWLITQFGLNQSTMDDNIKAIDRYTLTIRLDDIYAPNMFLSCIASPVAGVVDPSVVKGVGSDWLIDHSAGSGPYILERWERNELVELVANPDYWKGTPPIKRILYIDMPEPTNQKFMLEKGDIDVAWNIPPQMLSEIEKEAKEGIKIVSMPGASIEYLAMNVEFGPLKDERVREAVRYAIDYDGIIDDILRNRAIRLQTIIPAGYLGYNPSAPFHQDLEKAKRLLAEAGYPDGFTIELTSSPTYPRIDVAIKIQSDLAKVGIKANLIQMQSAQMYQKYRQQGLQMVLAGWGIDYPDPDALAKAFADYRIKQLAWRNMWYDDYVSDLTEMAMHELDEGKRSQYYMEITEHVLHKGPFAILYQDMDNWVISTDVKGFEEASALSTLHFDFTKISF